MKNNLMPTLQQTIYLSLFAFMFILTACAGKQAPTELINQAEYTIQQVDQETENSSTLLELTKAREHLENARQAVEEKNMTLAKQEAQLALTNAQLAQEKDKNANVQNEVNRVRDGIDTLQREIK